VSEDRYVVLPNHHTSRFTQRAWVLGWWP